MPTFVHNIKVTDPLQDVTAGVLGADAAHTFNTYDIGKAVKASTAQNFVLCTNGDEIEGILTSLEDNTWNGGMKLGTVQRNKRVWAYIGSNQSATDAVVGDYVVADAQATINTLSSPADVATFGSVSFPLVRTGDKAYTGSISDGTAQAGATGSITLAAGATGVLYGDLVTIVAGTGVSQARTISAWNNSTKVATVSANWGTAPDNTSKYVVTRFVPATPNKFLWRIIRIASGTGAAGSKVLIERL